MTAGAEQRLTAVTAPIYGFKVPSARQLDNTLSDGERRYGNALFELCARAVQTGNRGHPRQTLPKGGRGRLKNKGSQRHRRGPQRPKYQAPQPEHPDTPRDVPKAAIHAHHLEGHNAALRRRNSAFRRRTNTDAKNADALHALWTYICCNTTSSVHTGPPARYRPCDWVSWRPLCALKRS